ncbi:MAG: hypothetical protein RLZZ540_119 [Bacteroidota bacterium]|jgi:hypothetical protein
MKDIRIDVLLLGFFVGKILYLWLLLLTNFEN